MSQYSNCAFRFHQVWGHGVGSSQGPLVAITGASRRAAEAVLYSWIQQKRWIRASGRDRKLLR